MPVVAIPRKKTPPGPAFAGIEQDPASAGQLPKSCQAQPEEKRVGDDVREIGDAEPGSLVGESMVPLGLRDRRESRHGQRDGQGQEADEPDARALATVHLRVPQEVGHIAADEYFARRGPSI
jgi:hypothetical protein